MDEALIHDYLDGTMQEQAKSQFEDRLKTDEALRLRVEEYSALREMLPKALAFGEEKARARAILEQAEMPEKPRNLKIWFAIAAGVLLVCVLAWWLWPTDNCKQDQAYEYFAEQATPGFITQSMGAPGPVKTFYEQAVLAYQRNDIPAAKTGFQATAKENTNYQRAQIMLGTIALNEKQSQVAIGYLENAHNLNSSDHHAVWYLALAYLANCENEKARPLLIQVSEAQKGYHLRAKKLLEEIG